jgi:hypothetical protein
MQAWEDCLRGKATRGANVAALAPVKATLDALPDSTAEHHTGDSKRRAGEHPLSTWARRSDLNWKRAFRC